MARSGGRYKAAKKKGQEPERVEGTKPHPEGDAPRDADGNRIDRPVAPVAAAETDSTEGSVNAS